MKIHFMPPLPLPPRFVPAKPLPTPLETEEAARELIETARQQRIRRLSRRKREGNGENMAREDGLDIDPDDDEAGNQGDRGIDVLA
jgi:hypothetical protein